jgi:hypothetical protein
MHDEVSETENIRKNLAIERMIIEGCEILLDTSQTFVRQGTRCPHPTGPAAMVAVLRTLPLGLVLPARPATVVAECSGLLADATATCGFWDLYYCFS